MRKSAQSGFGRVLALIIGILVLLAVFHVDVRGYIAHIWGTYIYPFVTGETFSGIGEKAREHSTIEP